MNNQYTLEGFSRMFKRTDHTIAKLLRKNYIFPTDKIGNRVVYDEKAFDFLKSKYETEIVVEFVPVPVYVNVYWEIIPSKLNFEL